MLHANSRQTYLQHIHQEIATTEQIQKRHQERDNKRIAELQVLLSADHFALNIKPIISSAICCYYN